MIQEKKLERERLKKEAYESGVLMPDIMNPDSIIIKPETISTEKPTDSQMFAAGFKNPKQIENLAYIMKDIMQGEASLAKREEYSYLNFKQIKIALDWLMNSGFDTMLQSALLEKPYLLTFKDKPPTAEEFLTKKYIGSMADSIWLPVRKNFLNFFDPTLPYRSAILNPSIGSGKSTFTMLALLYVACCFALMRDPWKFFSMAQTSVFAFVLCAVTQTKASEIYREPIQQLIEGSDYWMWCRTHQDMLEEEKHLREADIIDYIPWSTAAKSAVFVTGNNLQWKQISSANSLLGVNILMGAMTEITFFKEAGAGWALTLNTPILMADNSIKLMKDIKIGDHLKHPDNKENIVTHIPFEEEADDYEITLDDGRTIIANYHHIWKVSFRKDSKGNKIWDLVETGFMLENLDKYSFEIPDIPINYEYDSQTNYL